MWYFVRRRGLKPRNEWTVTLDEHLVWMKRQHDTGKIVMSGPTPDRQYGQYLVRAENRQEAEAIAASDPFTCANGLRLALRRFGQTAAQTFHDRVGTALCRHIPDNHGG